ncbi:M23 family metallopeptidase [Actinacidiphila sp. ITFR-21]|uniref:M23 family metallopeptidase n=1 Tax=Actinacidiphila sp. ITFR-21 TaxID=3075199 RepID=UPI00288BDE16|nr:M23 family metallopeptidase [Streptomyces sp. ITFR-21]WNI18308.1 M23 family metallopeptidase [Streptomyces sp. ITFR-21]
MTFTATWPAVLAVTAALLTTAPGAPARRPAGALPSAGAPRPAAVPHGPRASAAPAAGCAADRCWPVAGPGPRGRPLVLRAFAPPAAPWAAGHRGVDLRAGRGIPVRAAAPGRVAFTGPVGGIPVVVLRHPGGLRTTYEPVRGALPVGAPVAAGRPVGVLTGALPHCPAGCLHWGLLAGDTYLDPLSLLPAALRRAGPSRLLPLRGEAPGQGLSRASARVEERGPVACPCEAEVGGDAVCRRPTRPRQASAPDPRRREDPNDGP